MVFAVHLLHVLAMAVLVGGGTAGALGSGSRRLEAVMWGAAGVIVATGVGNVGAYGDALPAPTSGWGALLLGKLVLVVALLAVSMRRSLVVLSGRAALGWYHASAALAVIIASLGVWLAHGG